MRPQPALSAAPPNSASTPALVILFSCAADRHPRGHERLTQEALAKRLAGMMGSEYGGEFDPSIRYQAPLYYVPSDTLASFEMAQQLGIGGERDLFGGVVPFPFVATKTITHPLVSISAAAPHGWSRDFSQMTQEVVLPGYSAFTLDDARTAGLRLLEQGAVRLKKPSGAGGVGQTVANNADELEQQLTSLDAGELLHDGLVCELNLTEVETFSVGHVRVGEMLATYYGNQRLTTNNHGARVYGGSDLVVVRGDFNALLAHDLPPAISLAISQARTYHAAAMTAYPGMFASRCNYDIARGLDRDGRIRCGVLEQSWRIGGATGAEIAALEAFHAAPSLNVAHASTTEIYGAHADVPDHATIFFQGIDPKAGALLKYSTLQVYADT